MKTLTQQDRNRSGALITTSAPSLTDSQKQLAVQLYLTALNSKCEVQEELVAEFNRTLVSFSAECIEFAFREWRNTSRYFPTILDIRELCLAWCKRRAEEQAEELRQEEREREKQARARGELVDFADIKKQLADIAAKHAIPTPIIASGPPVPLNKMPPPVPFTAEQIKERRARSRVTE
jgi:hypothetical protein